ncbi:hypothetical protein Zmor_000696 [Zophobas morio]|uniref:Uncharacterized protein n=1 Tax=Zophobas morio TaxID=2755281 RepID=A0AA38MIH3_9CUCU|nr:hypothetical protein Zmor_009149 [Zophobas morio]KAJ3665188.1 hypothetical protein Zmor_000696 [Zophobas morio]
MDPRDSFKLHTAKNKTQEVLEILQITSKTRRTSDPDILSIYVLQKLEKGYPRFFQITSETRATGGSRHSFKLCTPKTKQEVPEIFCNYIPQDQNTRGARDYFRLLQKYDPKGVPEIFQTTKYFKNGKILSNYFKNQRQAVPDILPNYILLIQNTRRSRDSFKLLQKHNTNGTQDSFKLLQKPYTTDSRDSFKVLQKPDTKGTRDSFRLLQKQDAQVILIFFQATYFKNWTRGTRDSFRLLQKLEPQEVPNILSNYVLQKPNKRFPRFFVTTYLKIKTHGMPEILSDCFKNKAHK